MPLDTRTFPSVVSSALRGRPCLVMLAVLALALTAACAEESPAPGGAAGSTAASSPDGAANGASDRASDGTSESPSPASSPEATSGAAVSGENQGDDDLEQITFMAGFRPQANLPFVAAYVADAKGFYAEEGLEVEIQHSSGQGEHLKLLLEQEIAFTNGTASQVLRRTEEGLPVVSIALFGQRGDQGYVAHADSGIEAPEDFAGRSVGFKGGVVPAELHGLLATAGLTVDDVELQGVGFDPRVFIQEQVEVYPVFLGNEPNLIRREGVEINLIDPHDFGVPTLGLTFLAHQATVDEDPDLVERFLRASMRGALYAAEHVDEAVEITLTHAEGADPEHQRFLLETDLENAQREDGMGRSSSEQWQELADLLLEFGVLEEPVDVGQAFDGTFIDALHESGALD